jgi:nitrite reductase/ring-hydroxylating ferredoxin subunit
MSVVIDGQDVVLFRYGSRIFATGSRCPHMRGLIAGGDIEDLAKHGGPPKTQKRLHRAQSIGVDADFDDHVFASTEAKPKARLCITCPVHGFQFDTDTGVSIMPPDSFHLPVFRVRIAGTVGRDTASAPAALAVPAHAPGPAPAPAAEVTAGGDARAGGTLSGEIEVGMTDFDPEAADADF